MRVFGQPGTFAVRAESLPNTVYLVRLTPFPACTCPGFRYHGSCKHLRLVEEKFYAP